MAAAALTFDELRRDIKKENLAPVYLIHGKEGYYTDILVKDFENILAPEDKEFNQYVLYAPRTDVAEIIEVCSRFPMMAERQVVIVKEAQSARADQINKLAGYVNNPSPSTVLVIVFRGEEAKGKDLISAVKSKGVIYESKKVKDWQLPNLIQTYVKSKSMNIDGKSLDMLAEYIGTDLSNLYNQIDKLALILGPGATITPASVERNIGISKDYNNFELVDALAAKDAAKVFRIAGYFASNPKANPLPVTTVVLYNFYSDLLIAFYAADKSDQGLMKELGLRFPIQLKKFKTAMHAYNAYQVIEAIWALRQFDNRSKGNGSRQDAYKLFHDLMFHLLSAPGKLY